MYIHSEVGEWSGRVSLCSVQQRESEKRVGIGAPVDDQKPTSSPSLLGDEKTRRRGPLLQRARPKCVSVCVEREGDSLSGMKCIFFSLSLSLTSSSGQV